MIEPHALVFGFPHLHVSGLLDLVLGEEEGCKGTLLPLFVCVVVGDRIGEQVIDEYLLPHSPSCSVWFLGENGGLRQDRTSSMQTHSQEA